MKCFGHKLIVRNMEKYNTCICTADDSLFDNFKIVRHHTRVPQPEKTDFLEKKTQQCFMLIFPFSFPFIFSCFFLKVFVSKVIHLQYSQHFLEKPITHLCKVKSGGQVNKEFLWIFKRGLGSRFRGHFQALQSTAVFQKNMKFFSGG